MTFIEALRLIEEHHNLIGKSIRGATIDEFVIVPTNPESRTKFDTIFLQTMDAQKAIAQFINEDVVVMVVCDKKKIRDNNILLYLLLDDAIMMMHEKSL